MYLWVLGMEFGSWNRSDAWNFEIASRFFLKFVRPWARISIDHSPYSRTPRCNLNPPPYSKTDDLISSHPHYNHRKQASLQRHAWPKTVCVCVCVCLFPSIPVTELHAGTVPFFVLVEVHSKFLGVLTERDSSVHSTAFHQEMCHCMRTTHTPFPQISSASY